MYIIKDNMMIVDFSQNIGVEKINIFMNTLLSYKEVINENKIQGLLISIKSIPNVLLAKQRMPYLVKCLNKVVPKIKIKVAIIDYSIHIYKLLKALTQETPIMLFKNINVAKLFLSPKKFKKDIQILIFDDDSDNLDSIGKEVAKLGYTAIRANTAEEFEKKAKSRKNDVVITQCSLNKSTTQNKIKKLSISKKLVENLPLFMDTAVETLVMLTGFDAKKSSHAIRPFGQKVSEDVVISMMSFKGDLHGNFVLIFPKEIVLDALEAMLGESVSQDSIPEILDGVKEFCNIITGSSKTKLQKKDISVVFDLPKAYTSLQATSNALGDANGLWIEMELKKKPFFMFISA